MPVDISHTSYTDVHMELEAGSLLGYKMSRELKGYTQTHGYQWQAIVKTRNICGCEGLGLLDHMYRRREYHKVVNKTTCFHTTWRGRAGPKRESEAGCHEHHGGMHAEREDSAGKTCD